MLAGVTAAITKCVPARSPGVTIARVAGMLDLNARTLQRRLASFGCSFRALREIEYQKFACDWLSSGNLSVTEISDRLGYSHPAHFARAFRRWTGKPPTAYVPDTGSPRE